MATQANDKTGSLFISKDKFESAACDCGLEPKMTELLWAKLSESSSQRIIAGATAPRQDAANVNNWHWFETDLLPWAKERLAALLVGIAAVGVPDKGWVKVTSLESCTGEASCSNRKGKRIVAYELDVKCKWKGEVDYDEVEGELLLPYVSEDMASSGYDIKIVAKEKSDASHKKAVRYLEKQLPEMKKRMQSFTDDIYAK
eukprot:CAMPEP_0119379362 /NCGR_PEP_ID=MMETSP1334-20130426/52320_1 /TAXON_ID=127549 /ORGANISM="Calcidiscus leptoporus, Strain RCC1130" /LENGTH=200 /DNA_ID=CAMNT_0007398847 /DNA_START=19 /DNA_END=621 /DNA_ORIENTATION=+